MSREFRFSDAQRVRENQRHERIRMAFRRFKSDEIGDRYNLHGIRRRGSATSQRKKTERNMMTKSDTIAEIMRINPTVNSAFLAEFAADQLNEYLQRLSGLSVPQSSYGAADFLRSTMRHSAAVAAGAA
jgi:hypothetical protein